MSITRSQISDSYLSNNELRPQDMRRDLIEVADLIELCFSDTLDRDGRQYIAQIRAAAKNPKILGFPEFVGNSLAGFVWEDKGRIIGNISLIPVQALQQRAYLIANVAVHPDHRRKGIANALTNAALAYIKNRKIHSVWLQVNSNNPAAIHLYQSAGFLERARRTTWHSRSGTKPKVSSHKKVLVTSRKKRDWPLQREWLNRVYPGEVKWHLPINTQAFSPGLAGKFNRLMNERKIKQWSARLDNQLIGTLSWQSSTGMADWLWLATTPDYENLTIQSLLPYVLDLLRKKRLLSINYLAGHSVDSFQNAGFINHRTLIWMHLYI